MPLSDVLADAQRAAEPGDMGDVARTFDLYLLAVVATDAAASNVRLAHALGDDVRLALFREQAAWRAELAARLRDRLAAVAPALIEFAVPVRLPERP